MKMEDMKTGDSLQGIEPATLVTVVAVVPISTDAIQLVYKTSNGTLKDRLISRQDEGTIAPATRERPWSFDGDGDAFKLDGRIPVPRKGGAEVAVDEDLITL